MFKDSQENKYVQMSNIDQYYSGTGALRLGQQITET